MFKVLLEYGAKADKSSSDKETPLHLAAKNGYTKVARVS